MATKKLRSQIMENIYAMVKSLIVFAICVYCGISVYLNGTGTRSGGGTGLRALSVKLLYWLEDNGYQNIVVGILLAIFGSTGLICLMLFIFHARRLTKKRTVLGRSILAQASRHQEFSDLVENIDSDLTMETKEFGTELLAGTRWLLTDEAIQISRIERVYTGEKKKEFLIAMADGDGNVLEASFKQQESRDQLIQYLRGKIPDLYIGNMKEIK